MEPLKLKVQLWFSLNVRSNGRKTGRNLIWGKHLKFLIVGLILKLFVFNLFIKNVNTCIQYRLTVIKK